jgi:hypothetical protein
MSTNHEKTNWGGLTTGLLAAGAIIGGAMLVCPGTVSDIGEKLGNIGSAPPVQEPGMLENAGKWLSGSWAGQATGAVGEGASWINGKVMSGIATLLIKAAGVVGIALGVNHLINGKSGGDNAKAHAEQHAEQKESFAIREDIRKMQSVMKMRMQAAGHMSGQAIG